MKHSLLSLLLILALVLANVNSQASEPIAGSQPPPGLTKAPEPKIEDLMFPEFVAAVQELKKHCQGYAATSSLLI